MTTMRTDRKPRGGFVRFMKKLDNPELEGKETNNGTTDLLLASERLGRELYQRYEKLLEWIAGECNWSDYAYWVSSYSRSSTQRQACSSLRWNILGIGNHTVDSMGMYNGDRSSILRKAVEHILSNQQSEQQESVSLRASATGFSLSPTYYYAFNLTDAGRFYDTNSDGPSAYTSRSG